MSQSRIEQLNKFLEQNPDDSFVKYALAIEYVTRGDDNSALGYFQSILEHHPGYTATYYHLGKLYQRRNENGTAEKVYREGMRRTTGKEQRAYNELQQALNELLGEEE